MRTHCHSRKDNLVTLCCLFPFHSYQQGTQHDTPVAAEVALVVAVFGATSHPKLASRRKPDCTESEQDCWRSQE